MGFLVVQRTASERREARSKNHARIDEISRLDDTFVERFLGLCNHRFDQLTAELVEIGFRKLGVGLDRLAVLPDVEPFARLLAKAPGCNELFEPRTLARLTKNLGDMRT